MNAWNDWQEHENEIIVEDYLEMLRLELQGQKYIKAERNRILQERLDRSEGSIEFKHQNISAAMDRLGLPIIQGYKPRGNYQTLLFEVLDRQLQNGDLLEEISRPGEFKKPETGIRFDSPPPINQNPGQIKPKIQRIARKFDPAKRDAQNRELGEAGEKYVYLAEKYRLSQDGKDQLADRVRWVSKEDGDGAGYDILSFTLEGEERWLEVKTTIGSIRAGFWITQNELAVSNENPDIYRLVRLFDFRRKPGAFKLKPPLRDHVNLHPTQYYASF
ncbi:MAG: DUF3883 domain-containing protein [Paracoccaceae bacterium]|nr:DUF3883 domain-containing protein [Paracoccaceae bacterium]MDE2917757.1 DUF3883 domain-containing protein [Paracoccaceae bacterium]